MTKDEVKVLVEKRIIVVANERLSEISASFIENKYSGIKSFYGMSGISGYSGTSGGAWGHSGSSKRSAGDRGEVDDKFELKVKKVPLIVFDDYYVHEITEDCEFIRVAKLTNIYQTQQGTLYGCWYTCENFFDAFTVLRVLEA